MKVEPAFETLGGIFMRFAGFVGENSMEARVIYCILVSTEGLNKNSFPQTNLNEKCDATPFAAINC